MILISIHEKEKNVHLILVKKSWKSADIMFSEFWRERDE